ncbi:MAG TPA: class I SAM-dependent methyltransferase [Glycomyces sp.]|nr:class I SAM-dependent methyltransferase [Glycomyces sp.]
MKPGEMWSQGDYAAVGDRFAAAARRLAETHVEPGTDVLDLACGPAPFAIAAAKAGARVTALDAAPALLDLARRRAGAAGLAVEWVEADMTAPPFEDEAFDLVGSTFGCMFAPDPAAMAAELVRLCRPGGRVAALAWTPDSAFGAMSPLARRFLPDDAGPSTVEHWNRPDSVAETFAAQPVRLASTVLAVDVVWDDLDQAMSEITGGNPAWLGIRAAVEPTGRWPELVADLRDLFDRMGHRDERGFVLPVDYLETVAAKA